MKIKGFFSPFLSHLILMVVLEILSLHRETKSKLHPWISKFMCMNVPMYIYIPKHIKNQAHGISWSYVDGFGCLFYLLYFYLRGKLGLGPYISEGALYCF